MEYAVISGKIPDLSDQIASDYQNQKHRDIVSLLGPEGPDGDAARAKIIQALNGLTGIEEPDDYSPASTARMLCKCRLREYALDHPEKLRAAVLALLMDAVTPAAEQAVQSAPVIADNARAEPALAAEADTVRTTSTGSSGQEFAAQNMASPELLRPDPQAQDITASQLHRADTSRTGRVMELALFAAGSDQVHAMSHLPVGMPSLLVPPPDPAIRSDLLGSWINGQPADPLSVAIGFDGGTDNFKFELADLEAEFLSSPQIYLDRYHGTLRIRPPADYGDGKSAGQILFEMQEKLPQIEVSDMALMRCFRDGLCQVLQEIFPDRARCLRNTAAVLRFGADLLPVLRAAYSLEAGWLQELGGQASGPEQNILGGPHPARGFTSGYAFRLAAFAHLTSGLQIQDACLEACLDIRLALIDRAISSDGVERTAGLTTEMLIKHCAVPASEYLNALLTTEDAINSVAIAI